MSETYGTRDIVRNPTLLRIDPNESYIIEDKKSHIELGLYLGTALAKEFREYLQNKKLLASASKIKANATKEYVELEGTVADGL